ncbi:MAG TPA: TRAP transporter small permease [Roseococcus sp.]|nr:TRAP transporter small permease [Roseococcus sp.]
MRRALDALYALCGVLAALALLGIFVVMMAQMILRQFAIQFPGATDLTGYLCVMVGFLGLAWTFRKGELIRVGLVVENLSAPRRRVMEIFALTVAAVMVAYITWWSWHDAMFSLEIEEVAQGSVAYPLWIPKLAIPVGAGMLLVAILDEWVTVLRGQKPTYARAAEARAAAHDYTG